ncbi:MAG: AMP-binding protein [Alphaproteobacteria bacterium]
MLGCFEHLAAVEPERLAAQDEVSAVTYGELNAGANRLACVLIDQRPFDQPLVAVFAEHGIGMLVAALAATKAGLGVTFPETTDPDEKIGPLLAQAGCAIVLTDTANLSRARTLVQGRCSIIDVEAEPSSGSADNPRQATPMDAVAFIRHTSGSTGNPKGAIYTFETLRHALTRSIAQFEMRRDDRIVIFESFGITVTYAALSVGASIHLFALRRRGAAGLASWLNRRSITLCPASPTVLRQCVGDATERIKTVRRIALVGEPAFRGDAALMERHFPAECVLSVVYGMSECPAAATYRYRKGAAFEGELLPSGWASPGIEIHILDDEGRRLPPGETGEVALLGDGGPTATGGNRT